MSVLDVAPTIPDRSSRRTSDVEGWRCAWTDGRERCHYPGSLSFETRGPSKWFCRGHLFCTDGATGQQIIEESRGFERGDERRYTLPVATAEPQLELTQFEPGANG